MVSELTMVMFDSTHKSFVCLFCRVETAQKLHMAAELDFRIPAGIPMIQVRPLEAGLACLS